MVPTPEEPKFNLFGRSFAYAINSFTDFTGTDGLTIST